MLFDEIIRYEGTVIRPPSEADSLIFQVTLGCSDNHCIFCPAYKEKTFFIKNPEQIREEFSRAAVFFPETRRIFLADGDAVVIPQKKLLMILQWLNELFPKLSRVGIYGSAHSLKNKTLDDLKKLKMNKLGIIYLGIESGDPEVYRSTLKLCSPEENIIQCLKVKEAGIKLNTTLILGLGGIQHSSQHVQNTSLILNAVQPDQVAALTLMIVPGTELFEREKRGEFALPDPIALLQELHGIISGMEDFSCLFFSNHASNYFPLSARFPKDKIQVLNQLEKIIVQKNTGKLRPEFFRAL